MEVVEVLVMLLVIKEREKVNQTFYVGGEVTNGGNSVMSNALNLSKQQ